MPTQRKLFDERTTSPLTICHFKDMKLCRHFRINDVGLGWRLPRAFWRATGRYFEEPVLNPFGGHSPVGLRCDIDKACKPDVLCDALLLPFSSESFRTVIFDPPYSLVNTNATNKSLGQAMEQSLYCLTVGGYMLYIHTVHPPSFRSCPIIAMHFLSGAFRHVRIVAIFKKLSPFTCTLHTSSYREPRKKGIMQAQLHDGRKKSERQKPLDFGSE